MVVEKRTASVVVDTSESRHARLRPLAVDAVTLDDAVWEPRRRINREQTLPGQHAHLEQTGRIDNFRRAAGKQEGPFQGLYFNDSDVYKWLEAAAWSLATDPDPALERLVDETIAEVAAAQQPDGYLDTYYILGEGRWTDLVKTHELYCAGHLFQAAVAHHRATGKTSLLDVARRFADHICDVLGPAEEGKQPGTDGHEEVELALVELARETGERRYLDQARYFLDARGYGLAGGDEYHQDHKPFRELDAMVGHAVRAVYLNAGAADIYAETGEPALRETLERLWRNMTTRRMYVSGGIGARYEGEAFGRDFELPNERAYTETCAAIGSVMWAWRMLLLTGEAHYADLMEHTLYNAVLPGVSLDGQRYFYQNPLADDGDHRRQPWFHCACCPPNVARLLASLPGYVYTMAVDEIWVHLYAEGAATLALPNGQVVHLRQRTSYPWDGDVAIGVDADGEFELRLRVPAWCGDGASLEVNGDAQPVDLTSRRYVALRRNWRPGDVVRLRLPMAVRRIACHPHVAENAGRVALTRGPILFCVEAVDNPGIDPRDVVLPAGAAFAIEHRPDLLGGVTVFRASAEVDPSAKDWANALYRPAGAERETAHRAAIELTAIPYFAWANREPGGMQVWLRAR
ncbi:MAG: glycoside hydrolase family 127 protein [Thermomicrobiales bacterium]